MSAVPFAALWPQEEGISTTRSVAPGATACTCSRSPASSPVASHGEAEPPRLVTTSIRAAGSRNVRSKLAKSRRISVGPAFGGGTGATTVTVSPRPSIPLSSNGWMPYATRYCCGEKQGPSWQYKGAPDGAATVDAAPVATVAATVAPAPAAAVRWCELPPHPTTKTPVVRAATATRRARGKRVNRFGSSLAVHQVPCWYSVPQRWFRRVLLSDRSPTDHACAGSARSEHGWSGHDQELRWRRLCAGEGDQLDADRRPDDRDRDRQTRLHEKYRQPGDRGGPQHDELAEPAGIRADDHTHDNQHDRGGEQPLRSDARVSELSPSTDTRAPARSVARPTP